MNRRNDTKEEPLNQEALHQKLVQAERIGVIAVRDA